jgi:mono/diheme cytochrome c family protein
MSKRSKRLRPGRGAGGERAAGTPPSEREWGCPPALVAAQAGDQLRRGLARARMEGSRAEAEGFTSSNKCRPSRVKGLVLMAICLFVASACRQDMHDQPKYRGLRPSVFFADGASARPRVEGTVARGTLQEDEAFFTGKVSNATVKELPFAIDAQVLDRGQERFNIYCSPCHGQTGKGDGMVVRRGYREPPSFHSDRLLQADAGYIFDVITNGFGVMPDYKVQIAPRDRWAIVAYLRALQLSQHAAASDIPTGDPTNVPRQPGGGARAPEKH